MNPDWYPHSAALELTLSCPHRCATCGSDAGRPRPHELSVDEWLAVVDSLAGLGTKHLALLGGEPLRFEGWQRIAAAAIAQGMDVEMVTSGMGLDEAEADAIAALPLYSVTVSVDGTEPVHDAQRRVPGSFRQALRAIGLLDARGVAVGVTTQINTQSLAVLEDLGPELQAAGVLGWQIQLTLPTGRARSTDLTLPPERMPELHATLRRMAQRRALRPHLTDSIGWFSCDDVALRSPPGMPKRGWMGCQAGLRVIGVTSDGRVKGCLSIPEPYDEGSLRRRSLREIWEDPAGFTFTRGFQASSLSGACAACPWGRLCRGGCTATALAVSGRPHVSVHCLRSCQSTSTSMNPGEPS